MKDEHVVHMVKSKPQQTPSGSAAPTTAPPTAASAGAAPPQGAGSMFEAAGLGGISEEQMQSMMNSPMVQSVLNNPELLRQMLESNPLFQRMARDHPEMQAMLEDPGALSSMMRSMADPVSFFCFLKLPEMFAWHIKLTREFYLFVFVQQMRQLQLRGLDNAMAHLNTIPGAFAQLSSVSSAINRSMDAAADEAAEEADEARRRALQASTTSAQTARPNNASQVDSENPFTNLFQTENPSGPNDAPLPNPWSSNPPPNNSATGPAQDGGNDLFSQMVSGLGGTGGSGFPNMPSLLQNPDTMRRMMELMAKPGVIEAMQRFQTAAYDLQRQQGAGTDGQNALFQALMMGTFAGNNNDTASNETTNAVQRMQSAMAELQRLGVMETMLGINTGSTGTGHGSTDAMGMGSIGDLIGTLGMGAMGGQGMVAPPTDPEAEYASQLQQLQDMGFYDKDANIRALIATQGNVHAAVERLLASN